ncbi:MAG: hypothetical protein H6Q64_1323 [Firmicutes bacterium]|nr:hypothetical protein [Bacillota bacterium]
MRIIVYLVGKGVHFYIRFLAEKQKPWINFHGLIIYTQNTVALF